MEIFYYFQIDFLLIHVVKNMTKIELGPSLLSYNSKIDLHFLLGSGLTNRTMQHFRRILEPRANDQVVFLDTMKGNVLVILCNLT